MLRPSLFRCALVSVVMLAVLPALVQAGALTDLLVAKIGVTPPQADGGAGSIFKLARAQMTPENFQKLRSAVPGMDTYLGAAPAFLPGEQPAAVAAAAPATGLAQTGALAGTATAGSQAGRLAAIAGSGSTSGGAASALLAGTALGDKLQTAQALAPAFQQLGMKQGGVAQFLPVVVSYVKSVGGKSSSKLLTHALGL